MLGGPRGGGAERGACVSVGGAHRAARASTDEENVDAVLGLARLLELPVWVVRKADCGEGQLGLVWQCRDALACAAAQIGCRRTFEEVVTTVYVLCADIFPCAAAGARPCRRRERSRGAAEGALPPGDHRAIAERWQAMASNAKQCQAMESNEKQ